MAMKRLAVASGKGGTGKTTVAVGLALASGGATLLDCDVEAPNAHILLGTQPKDIEDVEIPYPVVDHERCTLCRKCAEFCTYHALLTMNQRVILLEDLCHGCGGCSIVCPEKAISEERRSIGKVQYSQAHGVALYTGVVNIGVPSVTPVVDAVKGHLSEGVNILDAPPGTGCPVVATVADVDFVLLVTEPTPFGLQDLRMAVSLLRALNLPMGVVINKDGIGDDRVDRYCSDEGIEILERIPYSKKIAREYSSGRHFLLGQREWLPRFRDLLEVL